MKNSFEKLDISKWALKKIFIFIVSVVLTFLVLISVINTEKYEFSVNQISDVTIKATRDVVDEVTTEEKRKRAEEAVEDQYDLNKEVGNDMRADIEELFSVVISVDNAEYLTEQEKESLDDDVKKDLELNRKIQEFKERGQMKLTVTEIRTIILMSAEDREIMKNDILAAIISFEDVSIPEVEVGSSGKKVLDPDGKEKAKQLINRFFDEDAKGSEDSIKFARNLTYDLIRANYVINDVETQEKREKARASIDDIVIRKGQIVVEDGEAVTEAHKAVLKELGFWKDDTVSHGIKFIGALLIAIIVMSIQWLYLFKFEKEIFDKDKNLILISTISIVSLVLCRVVSIISPYLIPLTLAPLLMMLLLKSDVAITMGILNSILLLVITNANIPMSCILVINSILAAVFLKNMEQRNDILITTLYIAIINTALIGCVQIMLSEISYVNVLVNCLYVFLGVIFSGILSIGFLPFLESFFDIVTNVKLLELSNPNHPLLKRLVMEAPGTYHHSVLVGNLSEMAAQAVKANSVIARVGAFYHDIGKIKRPIFFKENQKGENPHDNITPNLSTLIITSHVKDGLELAKEHKLPMAIKDIIVQHHGSTVVKYFYVTMKNNSENPEEVREEDFAYAGPIPNSKEAAIVMLADSVEAAVRSIPDPTKEKIEEMVSKIIKGKLNEGQLDNCDLTLKDFTKIREAFLKGLSGIYHQRIEYPKVTNEKKNYKLEMKKNDLHRE